MPRYDFQFENGDLFISRSGDFVIAPSDEQHIEDTIIAGPNWWKQYPQDGCNAGTWKNGPAGAQAKQRLIQQQLQSDGYSVNNPTVITDADGKLAITPNATFNS